MVDPAAQADLMQSLSRLVRGLSALFWGLPIARVVSVQTCQTSLLAGLGVVPPVLAQGLLYYALAQIARFQPGERVWQRALNHARALAVLNLGLSPFLYWWKMMPESLYFQFAVLVLALSGLLLLITINQLLQRLAAMLPDETLRLETQMFTALNLGLLLGTLVLGAAWVGLRQFPVLSVPWSVLVDFGHRVGLLVLLLLVLLPLALTMALVWKIKETVLASVFALGR
jgi:hypothetical protein